MNLLRAKTVRALACVVAVGAVTLAGTQPATAAPSTPTATSDAALAAQLRAGTLAQGHGTFSICRDNNLACLAQVVTVAPGSKQTLTSKTPLGYGATELQKIYGLSGAASANGTVAVIDAGAYPNLESDLAKYRATYGLPACTKASGCFKQINYLGGKPYRPAKGNGFRHFVEQDVSVETALDTEMASAACPGCNIVEIQVPLDDLFFQPDKKLNHNPYLHFATGVQLANQLGYAAVSISYGYPETPFSDTDTIKNLMTQPGMAVVASSGDYGLNFLPAFNTWPQNMPTATIVGGTSVYPDASAARGYQELAWNGAGSGCSPAEPPAVGQPDSISSLCKNGSVGRVYSDVSAVADPYTGVAVYDTFATDFNDNPYNWIVVGGTSASSPLIAGMYARSPRDPSILGPNTIYADPASDFNDITIGTNFGLGQCPSYGFPDQVCDAGPGWDGPTGVGTPIGLSPFGG